MSEKTSNERPKRKTMTPEKEKGIQKFFDYKSEDRNIRFAEDLILGYEQDMRQRAVMELLNPCCGELVLDVGCGNARDVIPFAWKGAICVGVDFSIGMIKAGKEDVDCAMLKNVDLILASATHLPFKDNIFDKVSSSEVIEHDIFRPRKSEKEKAKRRIVCYGSDVVWKGFGDAVKAMRIVFKQRNDIEWIVFGLSPLKEHGNEASYTFIQCIFDEKLAELYSSADVVFCPSWYESFPLPPLEAMACGAPLVTTRYGTEDFCFDEENCLVVPPREPKPMAEAILRLLEDRKLADRLRESGLKTAQEFTWEKTVSKVESLFQEKLYGRSES